VTTKTETTKGPAESEQEELSRLRREEAEHTQALWERKAILFAGLALLVTVVVASAGILVFSHEAALKTWATASLTNLLTAFLAYLLGRQQSK
jgi:hypothetical protein